MDPAYVVKYAELYRRHWWWRSREKLTLKWLEQLKPESGFGLILDVGSGSGLFLEALSRFGQPEGVEADGAWAKHPTPGAGRVHYRPFDATFRPNRRYGVNFLDAHSSAGKRELNPLLSNSQGRFSARKAALIKSAVGGGFFAVQWWMARKNRDADYYRTFTIANSAMTAGLGTVAVHNYGVPRAEADLTSTTGQYLQRLPQ